MRRDFFPFFTGVLVVMSIFLPDFFPGRSNAAARTMYVTAIHLINLRGGPNMGSGVVGRIRSGEPIKILEQDGGWYHIRTLKGEDGWVATTLLTEAKPLAERLETLTGKAGEQSRLISQLTQENTSLKKYVRLLEISDKELKFLRDTNFRLKNRQNQIWAAIGASILIFGWFVGLVTRVFSWRKRSRYRYVID